MTVGVFTKRYEMEKRLRIGTNGFVYIERRVTSAR